MSPPSPHRLKRDMSMLGCIAITLSFLSPTIGVFIAGSDVVRQAGSWVILALLLAILVSVAVSALYAELGSAFPQAGGEYTLIGKTVGPISGFTALGIRLVGFTVTIASSGLGIAEYLHGVSTAIQPLPTALVSVVIVTVIAALSVTINAWITGLFVIIEVAALAATAILGFAQAQRGVVDVVIHPVMAAAGGGLGPVPPVVMIVSTVSAIFAFDGFGSAVLFGEELIGARRKVGGVVYAALGLGAVAIVPPMLGVLVGSRDLTELSTSASPVFEFVRTAGGPTGGALISAGVAVALLNAMIAVSLAGGRMLYASARDQAWFAGANRVLALVHPRFRSPWAATLVIGTVSALFCFLPLDVLVIIVGNGIVCLYGLLGIAVIKGRRSGVTARSQARMGWYPVVPALTVLTMAGVICTNLLDTGDGRIGVAVTLLIFAASGLYYHVALKKSRAWGHRDPEEERQPAA